MIPDHVPGHPEWRVGYIMRGPQGGLKAEIYPTGNKPEITWSGGLAFSERPGAFAVWGKDWAECEAAAIDFIERKGLGGTADAP